MVEFNELHIYNWFPGFLPFHITFLFLIIFVLFCFIKYKIKKKKLEKEVLSDKARRLAEVEIFPPVCLIIFIVTCLILPVTFVHSEAAMKRENKKRMIEYYVEQGYFLSETIGYNGKEFQKCDSEDKILVSNYHYGLERIIEQGRIEDARYIFCKEE